MTMSDPFLVPVAPPMHNATSTSSGFNTSVGAAGLDNDADADDTDSDSEAGAGQFDLPKRTNAATQLDAAPGKKRKSVKLDDGLVRAAEEVDSWQLSPEEVADLEGHSKRARLTTTPLPVHEEFRKGDFCLVSTDDVEFHIDSFHLLSGSLTFRAMFSVSTGQRRIELAGEYERADSLAHFLRILSGNLARLPFLTMADLTDLFRLVDKWDCPTAQLLVRLQLPRMLTCASTSRFVVFTLAAGYKDWATCAEAIRHSGAPIAWRKLDTPHSCHCHHGARAGSITVTTAQGTFTTPPPLYVARSTVTLLEPHSFDAERWQEMGRCMPALLALMRSIEYTKTAKGSIVPGVVACYFLHFMHEYDQHEKQKRQEADATEEET